MRTSYSNLKRYKIKSENLWNKNITSHGIEDIKGEGTTIAVELQRHVVHAFSNNFATD
jgi:hypothetical protein